MHCKKSDIALVAYVHECVFKINFSSNYVLTDYGMIVERTSENKAVLKTSRKSQHKDAFVVGNVYHYAYFTCSLV